MHSRGVQLRDHIDEEDKLTISIHALTRSATILRYHEIRE